MQHVLIMHFMAKKNDISVLLRVVIKYNVTASIKYLDNIARVA